MPAANERDERLHEPIVPLSPSTRSVRNRVGEHHGDDAVRQRKAEKSGALVGQNLEEGAGDFGGWGVPVLGQRPDPEVVDAWGLFVVVSVEEDGARILVVVAGLC